MPLTKSKSKKAFSHNVEAEIRAGKPQRQAVAIAYAVKRKAKKAEGGDVKGEAHNPNEGAPFTVINHRTGQAVGKANTLKGARRSKERKDLDYGGYAHSIKDSTGRHRLKSGGSAKKPNSRW